MSMRYQEFAPPEHLKPFVECFWTHQPGRAVAGYPVLPDGCVDIVYSPGTARELQVVGAMTRTRKFSLVPGQIGFGVRFRPAMSQAFLPVPGLNITDQSIDLSEIWGADARRLVDQISEARSPAQCIHLFETRLHDPGEITVVQRLCTTIVEQGGQVRIDDLAFQAGLSARQLRRLFLDQVGLSPKHFCRVIRFRNSLSRLPQAGRTEWAHVALDCGYYDQAHFINEFRQFSGYTPGEFVALER
jgi:AraC-like DNA-binding protein